MLLAVHLEGFPQFNIMYYSCFFVKRSVIASVLNQLDNPCQGNSSIIDLLMLKMVPALMSVQRVSGVGIGG